MYFKLSFIIYNKKEKKIKVIIKLIRKSISIAMRLNPNWIILFNSRKNNGAIKSQLQSHELLLQSYLGLLLILKHSDRSSPPKDNIMMDNTISDTIGNEKDFKMIKNLMVI